MIHQSLMDELRRLTDTEIQKVIKEEGLWDLIGIDDAIQIADADLESIRYEAGRRAAQMGQELHENASEAWTMGYQDEKNG